MIKPWTRSIRWGLGLGAFGLLGMAAIAFAAQPIVAIRFAFDPGHTGIIVSGWQPGSGEPGDQDDNANHGLVLQKNGLTATNAAAGAVLTGVEGLDAPSLALGLDYLTSGHCGNGAPRFDVFTTDGTFFVGCAFGTHTTLTGAASGWTRVTFTCSSDWFKAGGPITPTCPAASSTVLGLAIIMDEGTDTSGGTPGQAVLDNLKVNSTVVGKPGAGPM